MFAEVGECRGARRVNEQEFRFVEVGELGGEAADPSYRRDGENFSALGGALEYHDVLSNEADRHPGLALVGDDPSNQFLRAAWSHAIADTRPVRNGIVVLENVTIFSDAGMLLKRDHRVCLIGAEVNWVLAFAIWSLNAYCTPAENLRWVEFPGRFRISIAAPAIEARPGVLMSSPGHLIYGHWILDYAPRLLLAMLGERGERPVFYFHQIPAWATPFLAAFGVTDEMVRLLPRRPFIHFPFVTMPSGARDTYRLGRRLHATAWSMLKRFMERQPIGGRDRARLPTAARIFVTRHGWTSNRAVANIDRLEELAAARGYVAVEPSTFAVPAQARIFRQARIVIGEDGSALHNIVFAEPGCVLGVINTSSRPNLWHLGICEVLGHRLSYLTASPGADGREIADEAAFAALIDRLEAIASL
jgi:hypothetical protein